MLRTCVADTGPEAAALLLPSACAGFSTTAKVLPKRSFRVHSLDRRWYPKIVLCGKSPAFDMVWLTNNACLLYGAKGIAVAGMVRRCHSFRQRVRRSLSSSHTYMSMTLRQWPGAIIERGPFMCRARRWVILLGGARDRVWAMRAIMRSINTCLQAVCQGRGLSDTVAKASITSSDTPLSSRDHPRFTHVTEAGHSTPLLTAAFKI
jgi:hypothetical protein